MKLNDFFRKIKEKPFKKSDWLIIVLTGILLMIVVLPTNSGKAHKRTADDKLNTQTDKPEEKKTQEVYTEDELEKKLEGILSQIEGAGRVHVMITYEDGGTQVVEKDEQVTANTTTETDSAGGMRTTNDSQSQRNTVFDEADEGNTPFVAKELTPKIEGVLVVAEGGADRVVQQNISEAVLALFHVDAHRIKIVKMNRQDGGE